MLLLTSPPCAQRRVRLTVLVAVKNTYLEIFSQPIDGDGFSLLGEDVRTTGLKKRETARRYSRWIRSCLQPGQRRCLTARTTISSGVATAIDCLTLPCTLVQDRPGCRSLRKLNDAATLEMMITPTVLIISQGWGLNDIPLRASNEGLRRPRVARAQKIIRLHPASGPGAREYTDAFPPISSCAFHE